MSRREFSELPPTAESHFRLHVYGAILLLREQLPPPDEHNGLAFPRGYPDELDEGGFDEPGLASRERWDQLVAQWEADVQGTCRSRRA